MRKLRWNDERIRKTLIEIEKLGTPSRTHTAFAALMTLRNDYEKFLDKIYAKTIDSVWNDEYMDDFIERTVGKEKKGKATIMGAKAAMRVMRDDFIARQALDRLKIEEQENRILELENRILEQENRIIEQEKLENER